MGASRNPGLHRAAWHVKRAKRIARKNAGAMKEYLHELNRLSRKGDWQTGRGTDHVSDVWFRPAKIDIFREILEASKRSQGPVRILDDGAGNGKLIRELKEWFGQADVSLHATALTLHPQKELTRAKATGKIDRLRVGKSEHFVPKHLFDLIFSNSGSVNYVHPLIRKDHVLKLAHSLRVGGLLLASFSIDHGASPRLNEAMGHYGYLSAQRKSRSPADVDYRKRYRDIDAQMDGITKAFAKRGFDAKFYPLPKEDEHTWGLVIRRLK